MGTGNTPYISVVIAARNDNHGGNMLGRMQACVDSWIYQAKRLNLDSELIVVDWNQPAERPKLVDDLRWPHDCSPVSARFIEVSPEIHRTFANPVAIPLQQMIAKNVGIRRAKGEYVLATNLDIIFSAELMEFLASRTLEHGAMYRMDRHDIAMDIPNYAPVEELLDFAAHNVRRSFSLDGAWDLGPDGRRKLEPRDIVRAQAGIVLGQGFFPVTTDGRELFRWVESEAELMVDECPAASSTLYLDVETGPSAGRGPMELEVAAKDGNLLTSVQIEGRCTVALDLPPGGCPVALVLRAKGARVPLEHDMRLLQLRVFSIEWIDGCSDGHMTFRAPRFDFRLTDEAGQQLMQSSSEEFTAPRPGSGGFRIELKLGDGKQRPRRPAVATWSAEVIRKDEASDWSQSWQRPCPRPESIRQAAYLHTNACGDFTLLSRDDWFALRAYAEFPIWPTHLDSLFCYAAFHAGIREVILKEPMRIFHIEHFSGAGWTPEGDDELNARIARKGVTLIPYSHFVEWVDRMRRFDAPMIFTGSDWGLAAVELPETTR